MGNFVWVLWTVYGNFYARFMRLLCGVLWNFYGGCETFYERQIKITVKIFDVRFMSFLWGAPRGRGESDASAIIKKP